MALDRFGLSLALLFFAFPIPLFRFSSVERGAKQRETLHTRTHTHTLHLARETLFVLFA